MAIEIVDLSIKMVVMTNSLLLNMAIYSWFTHKKMVVFHSYVNVYQRVTMI